MALALRSIFKEELSDLETRTDRRREAGEVYDATIHPNDVRTLVGSGDTDPGASRLGGWCADRVDCPAAGSLLPGRTRSGCRRGLCGPSGAPEQERWRIQAPTDR